MVERTLIVILLFILGFAAYTLFTRRQINRVASLDSAQDPILSRLAPGIPAIVYFTTPYCLPCRTQQQPALARLRETLGETNVQIIQIDATEDPDSADRWGVFSAPTTFVIDRNGKTTAVNHGVADTFKLRQQLKVS